MSINNVISLLGGVALFLFGMTLMGDGLKKVAGSKLELVLYSLSGTTLRGLLLGTGVTAVIQSSSATSVMVVGFVNSGMMKLRQAISVIMGALIGTSVTGWIICLSYIEGSGRWVSLLSTSTITAVVAVIGIILRMFSKKQRNNHLGDILLGFAVLMFGMQTMSSAVSPLRNSPGFIAMLTRFSNPLLGIIVGTVFTSVLQSSSAAVGILQALSMTGAITFDTAYPIILGIAIGAAVPVLLSAIGASLSGRRTAFAYLLIELLGVIICGLGYYIISGFIDFGLSGMIMNPVSIASLNSIFRIVTAVVLAPMISQLELLAKMLIRDKKPVAENKDIIRLDERFLQHPALALEQSRITVNAMANTAGKTLLAAMGLMSDYSEDIYRNIEEKEDEIDLYEDKLGTYLVKLNTRELDTRQNEMASKFLHSLSDFERIGDHATNIAELAKEINQKELVFSDDAQRELQVLSMALEELLALTLKAFKDGNIELAYKVEPLEECIDVLCDEMKLNHIDRVQNGLCSLKHGFVFNDIITNYERVADHCSNIAVAMIELDSNSFDTHKYMTDLKKHRSHRFDELYQAYSEKFSI